jgi:nucleotide-binding universal stress UspA family protein
MNSATNFHVIHATDFSDASEVAFAHALVVALVHEADLTLLHTGSVGRGGVDWSKFPGVRPRLASWGILPEGADRKDVARELGVNVRKVAFEGRDPTRRILKTIDDKTPNFLVLGKRSGESGWEVVRRSVSEAVARAAVVPTLVIPDGSRGFVSLNDGSLHLDRVLICVDRKPDPRLAIARAASILRFLAPEGVEVELFHVGDDGAAPDVPDEDLPNVRLRRVSRSGDAAEEIVRRAKENDADLVVLATQGRTGITDALRGSVTERVLNRSASAVLAVPAT